MLLYCGKSWTSHNAGRAHMTVNVPSKMKLKYSKCFDSTRHRLLHTSKPSHFYHLHHPYAESQMQANHQMHLIQVSHDSHIHFITSPDLRAWLLKRIRRHVHWAPYVYTRLKRGNSGREIALTERLLFSWPRTIWNVYWRYFTSNIPRRNLVAYKPWWLVTKPMDLQGTKGDG